MLLVMTALSGCSSLKTYPDNSYKNLTVKTSTSSDSIVQDVNVYLHIYTLDKQCKTDYLGTVNLDKPVKKIGLPVNKNLYIDFAFVREGFFSQSSSRISAETLITPRKGYLYEADAYYENNIYDVTITQKKSAGAKAKKFKKLPYENCKPVK